MMHRINQLSLEDVNRTLRLIQETSQNQTLEAKGISARKPNNQRTTPTNIFGKVSIQTAVAIGPTSTLPVILSATISQDAPNFGFGSMSNYNWGL